MSDRRSVEPSVLNWRGPLLATAIFAVAFAVLLLMARQNESNTSDMGSSLRQDPYGTSLLFDSYQRAGYSVERSQDEDTLSDQNASRTTAFFVGGFPYADWKVENGNVQTGQFRRRVEDFLARGGRVVLVQPAWHLESKSQGWEVEDRWHTTSKESNPVWASPDRRAMPAESEMMYLTDDAPWLKTDAHWTTLYAGPTDASAKGDSSSAHIYMAMRRIGKGELIAAGQESFLLNEAIKTHPNPVLLDFLTGGRPAVWVDETLHGLRQEQGVLWLVQRYRLQAALMLFWASLLALLWSMSGDLVRRPARDRQTEIIRHGEAPGLAWKRLLQRSIPAEQAVAECWEQFRRRSPQDAHAISTDPQLGSRLRDALKQQPLEGYRQLAGLIAERRALGKHATRFGREPAHESAASPHRTLEEARIR